MKKTILFCNCGGDIADKVLLRELELFLIKQKTEVIKLSDLCGIVAMNKSDLQKTIKAGNEYLILGCNSRVMKLLLEKAMITIPSVEFINIKELPFFLVVDKINAFMNCSNNEGSFIELSADKTWPAWYPIIDYERCTVCGQCAEFCLFGVYSKSNLRVEVVNPKGCKNNCPACARICPQTAIIFPKYKYGGAIAGSNDIDEVAEQTRQTSDINEILGSDIYKALEMRKQKRQSIIRSEALKKAQEERDNALREN